jgi:hypothetical protein
VQCGVVMSPGELYRKLALDCARAAERTHDHLERTTLQEISRGYMRLADNIRAQHDHGSPVHTASEDNIYMKEFAVQI